MAENELTIVLKLDDKASQEVKKALQGISSESKKATDEINKGNEGLQKGFKEAGKQAREFRQILLPVTLAVGGIIAVTQEWAKHNTETRDAYDSMSLSIKQLTSSIGSIFAPAIIQLSKVVKESTEFLVKMFDKVKEGYQKVFEGITFGTQYLVAFYTEVRHGTNIMDAHRDAINTANSAVQEMGEEFSSAMEENIQSTAQAEIEMRNYNNELRNIQLLYMSSQVSAEEYYRFITSEESVAIQAARDRMGIMNEMAQELNRLKNVGLETFKGLKSAADSFINGFGRAWSQMIVEGKSFGESMKTVFKDMASTFIAEVGKMIAKWLAFMALKAVARFFGIPVMHSGGMVMHSGGPVRAHDGLAVDEVPIIAQSGEGIISRRGMAALGVSNLNALNQGTLAGGGGEININIYYPNFNNRESVRQVTEDIGFEIDRRLRGGRSTI